MLNWRSNKKEMCLFFQMIGSLEPYKIQYFITKIKNEQKYNLKIIEAEVTSYYFEGLKETKDFCQEHFNNFIKSK
jgi:hypothetical protein